MDRIAAELDLQITATLAVSATPRPWDASDEIGTTWWMVRLPTGVTIVGYDGIGVVNFRYSGEVIEATWTIADPTGPGAEARRAWIRASIAQVLGPDAIAIDAGRIVRSRGVA